MLSQTILTCVVTFLASVASASILPRETSDTNTCGLQNAGNNKGFTCGTTLWPCCGPSGFCGASDAYCLTTVGCQSGYSNTTGACYEPKDTATISPDNTCGNQNSGMHGYKCPADRPCCGPSGFCGSSDSYCLASVGCQSDFSNPESSCYKPTDGQTPTPDNTCGKQSGKENGYRCQEPLRCCSQFGYCGNTTDFCEISKGCQRGYGFCVPNDA